MQRRALRVDLLTPRLRGGTKPVFIERFGAAAEPLPYLDYLLEDAQHAAIVSGSGILARVPQPGRFALHKLLVARARPASMQAKSAKDIDQAAQIIDALVEDRPGDLRLAWTALEARRWTRSIRAGVQALRRRHRQSQQTLEREVGGIQEDGSFDSFALASVPLGSNRVTRRGRPNRPAGVKGSTLVRSRGSG